MDVVEFKRRSELLKLELDTLKAQLALKRPDLFKDLNDRSVSPPTRENPGMDGWYGGGAAPYVEAGPRPYKRFGDQLRAIIRAGTPGGRIDDGLNELNADFEKRAFGLSEGIGSEGGFALQDNFSNQLLMMAWNYPEILARVNKFTLQQGNSISIPRIKETSRENGSRFGGVQMYHIGEGVEKEKSRPDFGLVDMQVKKIVGLCWLTDELIQDVSAMEAWVKSMYSSELQFTLVNDIIVGTGAGQALGIINSGALVTVSKENGQDAASINVENITNMWSRFIGKNPVWHINQDCWPSLIQMGLQVGLGGGPIFTPAGGLSQSPYATLIGAPIVPLEQCSTVGTIGDILLCDWSQYTACDRGPMQQASSIHVRFVYDESVLRFVYRFDGQPWLDSPITPASGSGNTLSPFVALETRD